MDCICSASGTFSSSAAFVSTSTGGLPLSSSALRRWMIASRSATVSGSGIAPSTGAISISGKKSASGTHWISSLCNCSCARSAGHTSHSRFFAFSDSRAITAHSTECAPSVTCSNTIPSAPDATARNFAASECSRPRASSRFGAPAFTWGGKGSGARRGGNSFPIMCIGRGRGNAGKNHAYPICCQKSLEFRLQAVSTA